MNPFKRICNKIQKVFEASFGQTPLRQRNEDILKEAIELSRFTSITNLKEEHGDLLCSLLMSFQENDWNPDECISATLKKIKRREKQYQAYGRKLNIVILGGSFDPPHVGHIAIAELLLNSSSLFDFVWLMPCYKHLYNKKMASPKDRLEMCRLAAHDRRIIISDYEIKHKLGGETYQLVKKLLNEKFAKNQFNFSFAIGMDNALDFDKWQNFHNLERMIQFVVIPRPGYSGVFSSGQSWYLKPPHMLLYPEKGLPKVSSTSIRDNLNFMYQGAVYSGIACKYLGNNLNPKVFEYIRKRRLYIKAIN